MPFKLKLKKTRQYNVASKTLFVLSVELLDGGVADCTLSVDSTGQECLDNVCQRQAINQPEFFGLRYLNHNQQPRWVQLERPLKRQLDKYASSHQLYLRIMYYISAGMSLITDEVTRYHYFLQLKNDLVEGRIVCDCQQAVLLASYSRQAEYGNHDRERHTVEYLKNMLMFPKQMVENGQIIESSTLAETGRLEWLTAAVIQQHMALHNMSQAQAEEGFISSCQQLRGYGQEQFLARDQASNREVTIAISLTGITVFTDTSEVPHFYRWMDITNVINHKRTFKIECQKSTESATFVLPSPEDGKYVWRLCVLQHTYYMRRRGDSAKVDQPVFQEHGLSESREELDARESAGSRLEPLTPSHRAHSTSCLELAERRPQRNRALLPSYRPAPDYETAIQQKHQQQRAEAQLRFPNPIVPSTKPLVYGSHPDIHRIHYPDVTRHTIPVTQTVQQTDDYLGLKYMSTNYPFAVTPNVQTELNPQLHYVNVYKPPPPYPSNGLASNSTPDLAVASQALNYHRGYINSHVSGSSPDLVSTRTAINRQYLGYLNTGNHNMVNYGRPNIMPSTHGTYNNLASVLDPNPHILLDPHRISDNNIQKVYDERGNIMYSMPMHRIPYQRHFLPQQVKLSDTQEPIYENVPLPWQERARAHSLTASDELARLNDRNASQPTDAYTPLATPSVPAYHIPDNHYVNAQIINGVRGSSVPNDNTSNRSNKPDEFENITLSIDKISLKNDDETPYQSLSTHKMSNNNTINKSCDNITSIVVPSIDVTDANANMSQSSGIDSALSNSVINSTYSTSIELDSSNTTKSSVSSKEKKRRRWGMFIGRTKTDVKSATLGRDRAKATTPANKHRWSTGLPKFQPLPPSITKETLCQLLERCMSEEQLQFAFEQIPKGRGGGGGGGGGAHYKTALLPQHAALNARAADSLPYEDNRVRLAPAPHNPHGYINASHVTMTVGSTQRFYIVVRVAPPPPGAAPPGGPACSCAPPCELVWECAWQHGATVLVLVGGAHQPHYLPEDGATREYGKIAVSAGRRCAAAWGGSVRVRLARGRRARTLTHVTLAAHHDPAHMLEFLSEVNALRLASADWAAGPLDARNAPLVLCAEGPASAAGTALAADLLLHTLDTNQELDIPRTIGLLHQQRANLIQNVSQYRFLHQVLLLYLKQSRLI